MTYGYCAYVSVDLFKDVCNQSSSPNHLWDAGKKQSALLRGSLNYLETCYFDYVRKFVEENRFLAQPGGTGTKASMVRAFLSSSSARTGAGGLHPSDAGFGWHEVYQCLRAGLLDEAIAAAAQPGLGAPGLHHVSSNLHGWLLEWRKGHGSLTSERSREVIIFCPLSIWR